MGPTFNCVTTQTQTHIHLVPEIHPVVHRGSPPHTWGFWLPETPRTRVAIRVAIVHFHGCPALAMTAAPGKKQRPGLDGSAEASVVLGVLTHSPHPLCPASLEEIYHGEGMTAPLSTQGPAWREGCKHLPVPVSVDIGEAE